VNAHWRPIGDGEKKKGQEDDKKIILGDFEGFCFTCKKKGHKAFQCPLKNNKNVTLNDVTSEDKCDICGSKEGQKDPVYKFKEENANKRPQWLQKILQNQKQQQEQAQINID